jgi:hypothetical protein
MNTVITSRATTNAVLVGFASGVLVAVPAIMAAVASSGAGHGDYAAARVLFPAPMLLTLLEGDTVGALSILVGLLQFPIYGTLMGWSIARKNYLPAVGVALAHVVAASICFVGTLPNFS